MVAAASRWRATLAVAGAYLLLAIALTWPAVATFNTKIAGDFGDGFQNLWNFWWLKEALLHFRNPFFTDHLKHPFGVTLVFQTMTWPDALLALPLWAVLPPLGVYNAMVLWSFVLTGLGMYALVLDHTRNRPAAIFAGAAFMAVPFHLAHALGHQHLVSLGYLPLYLMFLHRIVQGGRLRDASLGGLSLAAAALCSWYQLLFAALWTMGVFGWALVCHRRAFVSVAFVKRALMLAASFLVIAGPLMLAMYFAGRGEPIAGAHDANVFSADAESFFFPGGRMVWRTLSPRHFHWTGNDSENGDYLGYVLLVLAAIGVWNSSLARAYGVTGIMGALLSMGPSLHIAGQPSHQGAMPYAWLVRAIPALNFSGVPVRFGICAQGALVVMAGLGLAAALERAPAILKLAAPALATALMLLELWPVPLPTSVWPVPEPMTEWAKSSEDFSVLDMSGDSRMLWNAIHHGKRCVGGYVTRAPKRLDDWWDSHPVFGAMEKPSSQVTLRLQREDRAIAFDFGSGPPAPGVMADYFEIRWDGRVLAPEEGDYNVFVMADDVAAVSIDGNTVVAAQPRFTPGWHPGRVHLSAGLHDASVDFHELAGNAGVRVDWEGPGLPRQVLAAAPQSNGSPGTFHASIFDARPQLGVSEEQAQAMLRELKLRYVVLNANDRLRLELFTSAVGMNPIWQGQGLVILELPPS